MSNETTKNFLEIWNTFQWPEPQPVVYRLYHDEQGRPLFYSMEDLPGAYIAVDQSTYINGLRNVRVVDGKLTILEHSITATRLQIAAEGGTPCDSRDICVIVESNRPHTKWKLPTDDNH